MNKKEKEKYFKQQFPQLKGIAFRLFCNYPNMELDDIKSEVFLKFCELIDKYDENKAGIYTFLMHQLKCVNNKLKAENKKNKRLKTISIDSLDFDILEYKDTFIKVIEFYEKANTELSCKAKIVLQYILESPVGGIHRIPYYSSVEKYFCKVMNWKKKVFRDAWIEIKNWWRNNDFAYN